MDQTSSSSSSSSPSPPNNGNMSSPTLHDLMISQNSKLSSRALIDIKIRENNCDEILYSLVGNLMDYKTSLRSLQNTYIQHNLNEKNKMTLNKIQKINELLNIICDHKWIKDYIDYPDGEGCYPVVYCIDCELHKSEIEGLSKK
jgi:hypothetical protein